MKIKTLDFYNLKKILSKIKVLVFGHLCFTGEKIKTTSQFTGSIAEECNPIVDTGTIIQLILGGLGREPVQNY